MNLPDDEISEKIAVLDRHGETAYREGRYTEALSHAFQLRKMGIWGPGTAFNAAQCLQIIGRTPEALTIMEQLHSAFPDSLEYAFYLSACLSALGDFERSYAVLEPLPDEYQMMVSHRGSHLIRKGEYAKGHAMLQSAERFTPLETAFPQLIPKKRYRYGMPLFGKRLLLIQENGLGDAIQCARFVEDYAKRGAKVIMGTPSLLHSLFSRLPFPPKEMSDQQSLVQKGEYDYYMPDSASEHMLVLQNFDPLVGRTIPYIKSDPAFVKKWEPVIKAHTKLTQKPLTIGIHWQGSRSGGETFYPRDIPFDLLKRFSALGSLFSFQRGAGVEMLRDTPEILDLATQFESLEDSAGALEQMDYLVTGCVFIAHLAGAMGKKTAFIASVDAHYAWISPNGYSEWYPSIRVFQQKAFRESESPIESAFRWIEEDHR